MLHPARLPLQHAGPRIHAQPRVEHREARPPGQHPRAAEHTDAHGEAVAAGVAVGERAGEEEAGEREDDGEEGYCTGTSSSSVSQLGQSTLLRVTAMQSKKGENNIPRPPRLIQPKQPDPPILRPHSSTISSGLSFFSHRSSVLKSKQSRTAGVCISIFAIAIPTATCASASSAVSPAKTPAKRERPGHLRLRPVGQQSLLFGGRGGGVMLWLFL